MKINLTACVLLWIFPLAVPKLGAVEKTWKLDPDIELQIISTKEGKKAIFNKSELIGYLANNEVVQESIYNKTGTILVLRLAFEEPPVQGANIISIGYRYSRLLWFKAGKKIEAREALLYNSEILKDGRFIVRMEAISEEGDYLTAKWRDKNGEKLRKMQLFPPKFAD